jgi:hypothetical protein
MKRFAQALAVLGVIWIAFSFLVCSAIEHSHVMQGGLMSVADEASYDDKIVWLGRIFGAFFFMGFLGAVLLVIGAILFLISNLIPQARPGAAQV